MVQSDTLSRRPDYGTNEQMEEEDKVVLPDNLFINLLDTELQERSHAKEQRHFYKIIFWTTRQNHL
jgi:hypothetical protein